MLNLAIVGLGYWGPNFARVIEESSKANLLWCCDLSRDSLLRIRSKNQNVKITTNLNDVLNDKTVDAVIVAVPAKSHYKVAKKAFLAGKDVLIEKPLATSTQHAQELASIAKINNRILMVDHIFLFNPAIQEVKKLIDKGELGKVFYGHGTYTALGPIRIDVSAMWDLSVHFIYTISYLLGEYPTLVSAFGKGFLVRKNADVAFLNLEFGKKFIFNLKVSWLDPVKTRSLVIVGDKKMVVFDDTQGNKLALFDRGVDYAGSGKSLPKGYQFILRYGDIIFPYIRNSEPLKEVLENFLYSIEHRKEPLIKVSDAVNAVVVMEAAEHSLKYEGMRVKLKRSSKTDLLLFEK